MKQHFFTTCGTLDSVTAPEDVSALVVRPAGWNDRIARRPIPSQEELSALFDYDASTGRLIFKPRAGNPSFNSGYAGKAAGYRSKRGYWQITIAKKHYWCHRVIWKLVHGYDPREIDHINGDKSDNRISNLRDVGRSQNNRNKPNSPPSGCTGVFFASKEQRWTAQISIKGKALHLGSFITKAEAVAARKGAEKALDAHDL